LFGNSQRTEIVIILSLVNLKIIRDREFTVLSDIHLKYVGNHFCY